jgi:uncharacterized membrane protein
MNNERYCYEWKSKRAKEIERRALKIQLIGIALIIFGIICFLIVIFFTHLEIDIIGAGIGIVSLLTGNTVIYGGSSRGQ